MGSSSVAKIPLLAMLESLTARCGWIHRVSGRCLSHLNIVPKPGVSGDSLTRFWTGLYRRW